MKKEERNVLSPEEFTVFLPINLESITLCQIVPVLAFHLHCYPIMMYFKALSSLN
jgi:hypothetical protein